MIINTRYFICNILNSGLIICNNNLSKKVLGSSSPETQDIYCIVIQSIPN